MKLDLVAYEDSEDGEDSNRRLFRGVTLQSQGELLLTADACDARYARRLGDVVQATGAVPFGGVFSRLIFADLRQTRKAGQLARNTYEASRSYEGPEGLSPHLYLPRELGMMAVYSIAEYAATPKWQHALYQAELANMQAEAARIGL
jgi:hypothetical protein